MEKLKAFVSGKVFQNTVLGVIVFNALLLGLETSSELMASLGGLITALDWVCTGIFVVELTLKLIVFRGKYFRDGWNIFDFFVVLVSLVPNMGMFSAFRLLRIFRVLRSLRTMRLVSGVRHLRIIIQAIIRSIPGIAWTGGLLLLIFYIFSIIGTTLFGSAFPEWFGSIGSSLYTLFQVMTLESWSMGISRPVMEVFPWAWVYFVPFVLISAFVVMNVVVGIVVNTISEVTAEGEKKEEDTRPQLEKELAKLAEQTAVVQKLLEQQPAESEKEEKNVL